LDLVLLEELKERLIAKHLGHFELMLVPVLRESSLNVALSHVEKLPVRPGTTLTDECSKGHIEMRTLLFAAVDAKSVEGILDK